MGNGGKESFGLRNAMRMMPVALDSESRSSHLILRGCRLMQIIRILSIENLRPNGNLS